MPAPVREISDAERRARLAVRHGLGPGCAFSSIASATAGMTAWHATELPSVHLAIHARTRGLSVEDVDAALNQDRSLVKQLSMRRTLFAVDRALLPSVIAGPGQRVAGPERRRLAKELVAAGLVEDGEKWLAAAESEVLELLDAQFSQRLTCGLRCRGSPEPSPWLSARNGGRMSPSDPACSAFWRPRAG